MNLDEEAPLTLPKWPFYLGDGLLVGLAITIATLNNWQLEGIQVIACVLAVALGAALMVLPYLTEYVMRVREETDDRSSELRLLKKQALEVETVLLQNRERLEKLESHKKLENQRYELLASAIDNKTQGESPDIAAFSEQLSVLEAFKSDQTKVSDKLRKELSALEKNVQKVVDSLGLIQSQLDILKKANEDQSAGTAEDKVEGTDTDGARKRLKKGDSGLLKRAIEERQDAASSAVSRIIDTETKETTTDVKDNSAEQPAKLPGEKAKPETETKATGLEETAAVSPEVDPILKGLPDDFSVSLGADLMMDDDLFIEERVSKPKQSTAKKVEKSDTESNRDLSEKKEPASKSEKLAATLVEVDKLMGIGNKPFLRGSGGGLNWETGVEMDFQEIGKWNWSAPVDLKESIEVQIYRNDEDADRNGKYTLEPGQQLEITPDF